MAKKRIQYIEKEKNLIHPIYDRKLVRPHIDWKKTIWFTVLFVVTACLISKEIFMYLMDYEWIHNVYDIVSYMLLVSWCMLYQGIICSKMIAIWSINVYQRYASAQTRLMCCYIPSCSEYAILAIEKYGAFYGGYKAVCRIIKCGSYGGVDYP